MVRRAALTSGSLEPKFRGGVLPLSRGEHMLRYAIIFLILSLVAGAFGLSNISALAKKISLIFFALFFIGFLILLAFAWLVAGAIAPSAPPATTSALPFIANMLDV